MLRGSPRLTGVFSGAVLGALMWAALDELGLWAAMKIPFSVAPLLVAVIVGAVLGAVPLLLRIQWVVAGLIAALLAVVAFTPLAGGLARSYVRADATPAERLDAVVVLSGGVTSDNVMESQSLDRLLKGIEVARERDVSVLVLSRETFTRGGRVVSDSADEARVLTLTGVKTPVLFIDSAASTRDEAMRVKRLGAAKSWRRIGLVTSPLHTRRACAVFERAGFTVTCIPAESRDRSIQNVDSPGERLHVFQGWVYEFAGTTDYRMKGWI